MFDNVGISHAPNVSVLTLQRQHLYMTKCKNSYMTIGDRIKEARKAAKLTQDDLGKICKVSRAAVTQWETGTSKSTGGQNLFAIEQATGYSASWLANGKGPKLAKDRANETQPGTQGFKVPIIQWDALRDWPTAAAAQTIEFAITPAPCDFALTVKGDAMTSPSGLSVPEGALISISTQAKPSSGDLVVAQLSSGDFTFKKLVIDSGQRMLVPLNPRYPVTQLAENCKIVGVIKAATLLF